MYHIMTTVSGYISYRGKMYCCRPTFHLNHVEQKKMEKRNKTPKGVFPFPVCGDNEPVRVQCTNKSLDTNNANFWTLTTINQSTLFKCHWGNFRHCW